MFTRLQHGIALIYIPCVSLVAGEASVYYGYYYM